jgi:hypothetical protein
VADLFGKQLFSQIWRRIDQDICGCAMSVERLNQRRASQAAIFWFRWIARPPIATDAWNAAG